VKKGIERRISNVMLPRGLRAVRSACEQAAKAYVPSGRQSRLILFRSSQKPLLQLRDPHAGWKAYSAQGLEIYEVEGDHDDILLEPQVQVVAQKLKDCLSRVPATKQVSQ